MKLSFNDVVYCERRFCRLKPLQVLLLTLPTEEGLDGPSTWIIEIPVEPEEGRLYDRLNDVTDDTTDVSG